MDQEGQPRAVIRTKDKVITDLANTFFKTSSAILTGDKFSKGSNEAQARFLFDLAASFKINLFKDGIKGNEKIVSLVTKKARELSNDITLAENVSGQLTRLANSDFGISMPVEPVKAPQAAAPDIHPVLMKDDPIPNLHETTRSLYQELYTMKSGDLSGKAFELIRFYSQSITPDMANFIAAANLQTPVTEPEGLGADAMTKIYDESLAAQKQRIEETQRILLNDMTLIENKLKSLNDGTLTKNQNEILRSTRFYINLIAARNENRAKRFIAANLLERSSESLKSIDIKDERVRDAVNNLKDKNNKIISVLYKQEQAPSQEQKITITKLVKEVDKFLEESKKYLAFVDSYLAEQSKSSASKAE